jgi:hypothetical protein
MISWQKCSLLFEQIIVVTAVDRDLEELLPVSAEVVAALKLAQQPTTQVCDSAIVLCQLLGLSCKQAKLSLR